jgi:hypothetical protein
MDNSVAALRRFAQALIEEWQSGFQDYEPVLDHLIYCGSLFFNAKPSLYSSSPVSLKKEYFFELDFRIILPYGTNPLGEKVSDSVAHVTGAHLFRRGNITRRGEQVQQATFLRQANWDDRLATELDISVSAEPYFEISPWWRLRLQRLRVRQFDLVPPSDARAPEWVLSLESSFGQ